MAQLPTIVSKRALLCRARNATAPPNTRHVFHGQPWELFIHEILLVCLNNKYKIFKLIFFFQIRRYKSQKQTFSYTFSTNDLKTKLWKAEEENKWMPVFGEGGHSHAKFVLKVGSHRSACTYPRGFPPGGGKAGEGMDCLYPRTFSFAWKSC